VRELLTIHYDPIYLESMRRNFAGVASPALSLEWDGSDETLRRTAAQAIGAET
jgi:tRNA 2-selenouridine synthase